MNVAVDAVGSGWLGDARAATAGFLVGLLVTFIFVRVNTRLIRAKVTWWFHDIESEGGTHVHHVVIGVVVMATVGFLIIALTPLGLTAQIMAFVFGAGVALTLDEFALILHLQDVYWRQEGRVSVDAVVIVVCAAALFVLGMNPFAKYSSDAAVDVPTRIVAVIIVCIDFMPALICLLKGKVWTGVFGLFVPFIAFLGAIRLARPHSPWAHRGYRKRADKLARAERRETRVNAHVVAWRDAVFDLIAGKPHLPSLPPPSDPGSDDPA